MFLALLCSRQLQTGSLKSEIAINGITLEAIINNEERTLDLGYGRPYQASIKSNTGTKLNIPSSIIIDAEEYSITKINSFSFYNTNIETIKIGSKVSEIGSYVCAECKNLRLADLSNCIIFTLPPYMFSGCIRMTSLLLPKITILGEGALIGTSISTIPFEFIDEIDSKCFMNSHITDLDLSFCHVTIISSEAFSGCHDLTSIILPQSLQVIGYRAFRGTQIETIEIPSNVESIDSEIFENCDRLKSVKILSERLTSFPYAMFKGCRSLIEIEIPPSIKEFGAQTFSDCGLSSISIRPKVSKLGEGVFANCVDLISIDLGNTLITELPSNAFYYCVSLVQIILPKDLISIGSSCFQATSIIDIYFPSSLQYLSPLCFCDCQRISNINLENTTITEIPDGAFKDIVILTKVVFPSKLVKIGEEAFRASSIASISFPPTLEVIGKSAFRECQLLNSIDLSHTKLSLIDNRAFAFCSALTTVYPPQSLSAIGKGAFKQCENLIYMDLSGTKLTKLENKTFELCTRLVISLPSSLNEFGSFVLSKTNMKTLSFSESMSILHEQSFSDMKELEILDLMMTSIKYIPRLACDGCKKLERVLLPGTVESIDEDAFRRTGLVSILFSHNLEVIQNNAFERCFHLTEIDLSETNLKEIGKRSFWKCEELSKVTFPSSLLKIDDSAFSYCSSLESITLPPDTLEISRMAFKMSGIKSIDISLTKITKLPPQCFSKCQNLKKIVLNEVVQEIGYQCFAGSGIKKIVLPVSVVTLESEAFMECERLKVIDLSRTQIQKLGEGAFSQCQLLDLVFLPPYLTVVPYVLFSGSRALTTLYYCGETDFAGYDCDFSSAVTAFVCKNYPGKDFMRRPIFRTNRCGADQLPPPTPYQTPEVYEEEALIDIRIISPSIIAFIGSILLHSYIVRKRVSKYAV